MNDAFLVLPIALAGKVEKNGNGEKRHIVNEALETIVSEVSSGSAIETTPTLPTKTTTAESLAKLSRNPVCGVLAPTVGTLRFKYSYNLNGLMIFLASIDEAAQKSF